MEINKTIEINFTDVKPMDLFGEPIKVNKLHEVLSNGIYRKTGSIRIVDIVKELFYGKSVQIDATTLQELIGWSSGIFVPFIEVELMKYLNEKLNALAAEQSGDV